MAKIIDRRGQEEEKPESTTPTADLIIKEVFEVPAAPDYSKINFVMMGDRILIQEFPRDVHFGRILVPGGLTEVDRGRVVAVGDLVTNLKVGDVIYKMSGLGQFLINSDGVKYLFLPQNATIAIDRSLTPRDFTATAPEFTGQEKNSEEKKEKPNTLSPESSIFRLSEDNGGVRK